MAPALYPPPCVRELSTSGNYLVTAVTFGYVRLPHYYTIIPNSAPKPTLENACRIIMIRCRTAKKMDVLCSAPRKITEGPPFSLGVGMLELLLLLEDKLRRLVSDFLSFPIVLRPLPVLPPPPLPYCPALMPPAPLLPLLFGWRRMSARHLFVSFFSENVPRPRRLSEGLARLGMRNPPVNIINCY